MEFDYYFSMKVQNVNITLFYYIIISFHKFYKEKLLLLLVLNVPFPFSILSSKSNFNSA
jgi:hypothetical protein